MKFIIVIIKKLIMTTLLEIYEEENPNIEEIKSLIEKGANVNEKDNDGKTPLHRASIKGNLEIVKLLKNHLKKELENYINKLMF